MCRTGLAAIAVVAAVSLAGAGCSGGGRSTTTARVGAASSTTPGSPSASTSAPTSGAPSGSSSTQVAGAASWPTYHHDVGRSGADPSAPSAGPVTKSWTSPPLDGAVYGEPLVVGDRVVVATEGDSVYALAVTTGAVLWSTHLGSPIPGRDLLCGDIDPSGITGTPVIDQAAGVVWVVAFVMPGRHDLVAVDLGSGRELSRRSADPAGADPRLEQQRGALTLAGGTVYVPFGGLYGDCGQYRGYVVGLPATGAAPIRTWQVPTAREGGIWAPPGPVVDAAGDLFVTTGNTQSTTRFDGGNAVVRLSPDLQQQDLFAPTNWARLSAGDIDLGSVSPTLLPGGLVFQVGKEGVGYLLAAAQLGGIGGQAFAGPVCASAFGGTAVSGSRVFVPCRDGLVALDVGPGARFTEVWRGPATGAGSPVVAGGVVWAIDTNGRLWGLDQQTGRVRSQDKIGPVTPFPSLSVAGGRLFAATANRVVSYLGV